MEQWKREKFQAEAPKPIELKDVHDQQLGDDGTDDLAHPEDVDIQPLQVDIDADQHLIASSSPDASSALVVSSQESPQRRSDNRKS